MRHITFAICFLLIACTWAGAQRPTHPDPTALYATVPPSPDQLRAIEAVQKGAELHTAYHNLTRSGLSPASCRVTITSLAEGSCPPVPRVMVPVYSEGRVGILTYTMATEYQEMKPMVTVSIQRPQMLTPQSGSLRVAGFPVPALPAPRPFPAINPIYQTKPEYPVPAIQQAREGMVRASVKVQHGGVESIKIHGRDLNSNALFIKAVEDSLHQWRFDTGAKGTIETEFRFFFVR